MALSQTKRQHTPNDGVPQPLHRGHSAPRASRSHIPRRASRRPHHARRPARGRAQEPGVNWARPACAALVRRWGYSVGRASSHRSHVSADARNSVHRLCDPSPTHRHGAVRTVISAGSQSMLGVPLRVDPVHAARESLTDACDRAGVAAGYWEGGWRSQHAGRRGGARASRQLRQCGDAGHGQGQPQRGQDRRPGDHGGASPSRCRIREHMPRVAGATQPILHCACCGLRVCRSRRPLPTHEG